MTEQLFRWSDGVPIRLMRIEARHRLYAFHAHKNDEMIFSVVPKGGYRGSAKMLKALMAKRGWSQAEAARELEVSESAISKYVAGTRTMLLRVALDIEWWNTKEGFDDSWQRKHKREKIFKLNKGIHIASMRIEALGKLYAYDYHKKDEMVFKAVPKREYQEGKLLKEVRVKNAWSQKDVADVLGVSQSMVAKYESGDRVPSGRAAVGVGQLIRGMTLEEIKQLRALRRKLGM